MQLKKPIILSRYSARPEYNKEKYDFLQCKKEDRPCPAILDCRDLRIALNNGAIGSIEAVDLGCRISADG